jgi:hypothetical protein
MHSIENKVNNIFKKIDVDASTSYQPPITKYYHHHKILVVKA